MRALERILSGEFANPSTLFGAVFYALVCLVVAWLSLYLLHLSLARLESGLLDRTTVTFSHRMGNVLIWGLALILYAHLIPELRSLGTALLTGASVASILVGLAAQNTLGNMIAGLSLLLYRPFQIGDSVQLTVPASVQTGKIEDFTLGYTLIKTLEKHEIVVPNSVMLSQAIIKSSE
jgi:small-conductance mechanosensitive channel